MRKWLLDACDLLRMRFKPLEHYVYPAWLPLGWLLLLGFLDGMIGANYPAPIWAKVAFSMAFNLIDTLILVFFLIAWWRYILRRPVAGSLFPLVVLCSVIQVLELVSPWLGSQWSAVFSGFLWGFSLYLLNGALASALNERRLVVMGAIVAYVPVMFCFYQLVYQLLTSWGWIIEAAPAL